MHQEVEARLPQSGMSITGAVPSGVTKKVAALVGRRIKSEFTEAGKTVHLKGVRFIPSTKVDLGEGAFQVLANVILQVAGQSGARGRAESLDSVVTVQRDKSGQVLRTVSIPALEWMGARGN